MYPSDEQIKKWHDDPNNWKWGLFYFNKADTRVLVDKRINWMGVTINFAHPKSYWFFIGMICFFGFIVLMIALVKK